MELLTYAFNSTCTFPFERCLFKFNGREFVLISGTEEYCEVLVTIIDNPDERDVIFNTIQKFLFCFGWANDCKFNYRGYIAEGISKPVNLFKRRKTFYMRRYYRNFLVGFDFTISPTTYEQQVALSLYNDAQYSVNLFYEFVCSWKILEIPYANRTLKASEWVNDIIKKRSNIHITNYIADLISKGENVGKYFGEKCRNAIFHITREPTVVSFKARDYKQIGYACAGIEPFVRYFIKKELHLPKQYDGIEVLEKKPVTSNTGPTWINYELFTERWLGRAERKREFVDDGDRFISLWIAFNGWMKSKFSETLFDRYLINEVKAMKEFNEVFRDLKNNDRNFLQTLEKFEDYTVADMRYVDNSRKIRKYDGSLDSLMEAIYQIRCNLFHGRKNLDEDRKDKELVSIAYNILLPLFKKYLGQFGHN
jgi:hypothetical protein